MKTKFNNFLIESDDNPFFSHNLRLEKGYKPKYRSGLIAVRFQDDEKISGTKYKDVDNGQLRINYNDVFSDKNKSDFINYFEDRYDVKLSDYKGDDFFIYFKCKPGTEKEKIEEIAKDKIVKVVDYVDTRYIESGKELENIGEELSELGKEFSDTSEEEIKSVITNAIEKLKKLL